MVPVLAVEMRNDVPSRPETAETPADQIYLPAFTTGPQLQWLKDRLLGLYGSAVRLLSTPE